MKHRDLGYTLIEIVLVLALAGLLFLVVFLAVAQAQRERRDAQRKQDIAALSGFAIAFAGTHEGQIATSQVDVDAIRSSYFLNRPDPTTRLAYNVVFRDNSGGHADPPPPVGTVYYQLGSWCNRGPASGPDNPGDIIAGHDAGTSRFVVWITMETGGVWCADNN